MTNLRSTRIVIPDFLKDLLNQFFCIYFDELKKYINFFSDEKDTEEENYLFYDEVVILDINKKIVYHYHLDNVSDISDVELIIQSELLLMTFLLTKAKLKLMYDFDLVEFDLPDAEDRHFDYLYETKLNNELVYVMLNISDLSQHMYDDLHDFVVNEHSVSDNHTPMDDVKIKRHTEIDKILKKVFKKWGKM